MKKRVLIASIFSGNTMNSTIVKLSPTHVILIVEKNLDKLKGDDAKTKRDAIKNLQKIFNESVNISFLEVNSIYDIYEIAKKTIKKIDELQNSEIILNISEGRKPISYGMSFAAYLRKEKVSAMYYLIKETDKLLRMPFLTFSINGVQKEILKSLTQKNQDTISLRKKINKSKSVFYKYLKNLINNGYLVEEDHELKITELGRIMIL